MARQEPGWDDFRFEFDDDGTFHMRGFNGRREAVCPVCGDPIRWCLDMLSFTTGFEHTLAHARCVWLPEAFDRERRAATSQTQGVSGG